MAEAQDASTATPFPIHKLSIKAAGDNCSSSPRVVLVSCGSFNPPTIMHLRMFDLAAQRLRQLGWDVLGGYISPVGELYGKPGLASAQHRLRMCELAAAASDWIMVDSWEAAQPIYTRTLKVLRHVQQKLQAAGIGQAPMHQQPAATAASGACMSPEGAGSNSQPAPGGPAGRGCEVRVMLLCGSDLLASLEVPGVWEDPEQLLQQHGIVCLARDGSDAEVLLAGHAEVAKGSAVEGGGCGPQKDVGVKGVVARNRKHVVLVHDSTPNHISSTAVRAELAAGRSAQGLISDAVALYIKQNGLYGTKGGINKSQT